MTEMNLVVTKVILLCLHTSVYFIFFVSNVQNVRVFADGSLYITNVQPSYAGNFTCQSMGSVHTHILTVLSQYLFHKLNVPITVPILYA